MTIVPKGAKRWTNESYFYTNDGNPGKLVAPIKAGAYQLWYVTGRQSKVKAAAGHHRDAVHDHARRPGFGGAGRRLPGHLDRPQRPERLHHDRARWLEGRDLCLVRVHGVGQPGHDHGAHEPGAYEIWYASDRVAGTFAKTPIQVK